MIDLTVLEKDDIDILQTILIRLSEGKDVDSSFIIKSNIAKIDARNPSEGKKSAGALIERYMPYIIEYCGGYSKKGAFGDDIYILKKDERTMHFLQTGGFQAIYSQNIENREKDNTRQSIQDEIELLTLDNLRYEREMRKWQKISAWIGVASFIIGVVGSEEIKALLKWLINLIR